MAHPDSDLFQDVMQVCLNGHVITDLARTYPERRRTACDRCGAATIDRCPTCGTELPGAVRGARPGAGRHPPAAALLLRLRGGLAVGAAIQAGRRRPDGPAGTTAPPPAAGGPSAALAAGRPTAFPGGG